MKKVFRQAFGVLKRCWKILFLAEMIYKAIASYLIYPLCRWLLNEALMLTGAKYLSLENLGRVAANPLNDLVILSILIILALYSFLEVSFIVICIHQAQAGKELGLLQLIKESVRRSLRVLKPQNWFLIAFLIIIIPFANIFQISNLINNLQIPWFIAENTIAVFPWNILYYCLIVFLAYFIFPRLLSFFYFIIDGLSSKEAFSSSVRLFKKQRIKAFLLMTLFYLIVFSGSLLAIESIKILTEALIQTLASGSARKYLSVSFLNMSEDVLRFIMGAIPVFANYAFLGSFYYLIRARRGEKIPAAIEPRHVKARRNNTLIFVPLVVAVIASSLAVNTLFAALIQAVPDTGELLLSAGTLVIGHRGNAVNAPENTLPAFQQAIDLGADYAELDVQESRDGVIVVTHDSNFSRCAGYDGNVWEMDYSDIAKLDAGAKFDPGFAGTRIPTLDEVIKLCKGKIKLLIELKTNGHDVALAQRTLQVIADNDAFDDIMIHSLSYDELKKVKELRPSVQCGYIMTVALGDYQDLDAADFFTIETDSVTSEYVSSAHAHNKRIFAWTVDLQTDIDKVIKAGADAIITNNVTLVKQTLANQENDFLTRYRDFLK